MDNIKWQGNSKKMYEAVLAETPPIYKEIVKKRIEEWIAKNNIRVVTEDLVFKAVDDMTPSNYAKMIKSELEKLKG